MRVIEQLVYKVSADTKDFNKGVDTSEKKVTQFSKAGKAALTALTAGGILVATKAMVNMGKEFISAASDAEETRNKFNVTFSDIRDEADATAKSLADSFGLSSQKSQQLLSDTGDLLTGFGFTQESALDLSTQVNELAVDLASFTNYSGGAEGASAALTKALLGERESIKSLGIAITEADINRLAEDKGIEGELTRQQKAMLTLELATTQSKNAIGDFERSQDSLANQQRILQGNLEDLRVQLGNKLLPVATNITSAFVGLTDRLSDNDTVSEQLVQTTSDLEGISKDYQSVVNELSGDISDLNEAERVQLELRKAQLAQEISGKIAEQIVLYDKVNRALEENTGDIKDNEEQIALNIGKLDRLAERYGMSREELIRHAEAGKLNTDAQQAVADITDANNILILDNTRKQQENRSAIAERNSFIAKSAQLIHKGVVSLEDYNYVNSDLVTQIEKQVEALRVRERAQEAFNEGNYDSVESLEKLIDKIEGNIEEYGETAYSVEYLRLAKQKLKDITEEETEATEDNTDAKKDNTEATEDNLITTTAQASIYSQVNREGAISYDVYKRIAQAKRDEADATKEAVTATQEWLEENREAINNVESGVTMLADTWSYLNDMQANQHEAELRRLEESHNIRLANMEEELRKDKEAGDEQLQNTINRLSEEEQAELRAMGFIDETKKQRLERQLEEAKENHEDRMVSLYERLEEETDAEREAELQQTINKEESEQKQKENTISTAIEIQEKRDEIQEERLEKEEDFKKEQKRLEDELEERKQEIAIEEAKREKRQSTFEAIVNTASAVVQSLPNFILAGLAAAAGAAQIAAIQSEPLPEFDVGSIRIPQDTQAVVHENEMILPAPIAQQARNEGVQIAPSNKKDSGTPIVLVIELDGKVIGKTTVDGINAGQFGRINARIVK